MRSGLRRLAGDQGGASTLEFALLMAAIAIPLYGVFRMALDLMIAQYQMVTFINGWPFP